VLQPIKSLRGFQRVVLEAGETKHITIALPVSQLSYYDVVTHNFIVSLGTFKVMIGSSADDIRLRTDLEID
jgi:beta-glucosidase